MGGCAFRSPRQCILNHCTDNHRLDLIPSALSPDEVLLVSVCASGDFEFLGSPSSQSSQEDTRTCYGRRRYQHPSIVYQTYFVQGQIADGYNWRSPIHLLGSWCSAG